MTTQNILFAVLLLICTSCNPAKGNGIWWLDGKWTGTGCEPHINTQWLIDLSYDLDENKIEVRYPKFNCTGAWELVSFDDRQATYKEISNARAGTCYVGQIVIVTLISDQFINISYFNEGLDQQGGGFVQGFAVLRKL